MNNSDLEKILCFMYVNAEFFAAPFLDRDSFSSWGRKEPGMQAFSRHLHNALETSKPVSVYDIDLLKNYRVAIVGATVSKAGNFSRRHCLLTGYSDPLFRVLKGNPRLASTLKKHMNSNFFDNWYHTQSPEVNNKRTKRLAKLDLLIEAQDRDFELYQARKLNAIHSICLPAGVALHYGYNGHAISYDSNRLQKPTEIKVQQGGIDDISELKLLVDKYNYAQSARDTLRNPNLNVFTRLNQFSDKIKDKHFVNAFTADNDSDGTRLLKTIGYFLTTLIGGLGLYLSYKNKGTYKFWSSAEEELLESTKEHFDMQMKCIGNPKVWGK